MNQLREDIDNVVAYHSAGGREWLVSDEVLAAARQLLALTEGGLDYQAAAKVLYLAGEGNERGWQTINRVDDPVFRQTVDKYESLARQVIGAALLSACDVTNCSRPPTTVVVGEAGDLYLCAEHEAN